MDKEEAKLLRQEVQALRQILDAFLDVYYRTNLPDKMILEKDLVMRNVDINVDGTKGLKIGKAATQKLGFYGKAPIVQPGAISSPSGGVTQDSEARTAITAIIAALHNEGLIA